MPHYDHARPGLTVDLVIIYNFDDDLKILLIKRGNDPFKGSWALPGGYVEEGETISQAAHRELEEETGITDVELSQMGTYGDPGRDPRGWTATVVFMGHVADMEANAGDDAKEAKWFSMKELPELAFDHGKILQDLFV